MADDCRVVGRCSSPGGRFVSAIETLRMVLALSILAMAPVWPARAQEPPGVESRFADVGGVRLHYLSAGTGPPVVLLHGYTQTSHMWLPLFAVLAKSNTVIAPDLRGAGQSATPEGGYD